MNKRNENQVMYFTNLICETLPDTYKNKESLHNLALSTEGHFLVLQVILSNKFKSLINSQIATDLSRWKNGFHQCLLNHFTNEHMSPVCLLNLQPFTRTIIIQLRDYDGINTAPLEIAFSQLILDLEKLYGSSIIGCFGGLTDQLLDIGHSYKEALKLQEYTYAIGLSNYAFYDIMHPTTDASLIEYKYIPLFNELFTKKAWIDVYELLDKIKKNLTGHFVNNSKTIYLYKEIYGVTIRHLFDQVVLYKDAIQQLNEGINLFDHLFDDIETVHSNYLQILGTITKEDNKHLHPSIKKALKMIHSNYMEALSLNYLSEALQLSTAYFSRLFKEEMAMNFKEYLTRYRINTAKKLLLDTSKEISEIATAVGYTSSSQLVRVFKAIEGMTPTTYRQLRNQ